MKICFHSAATCHMCLARSSANFTSAALSHTPTKEPSQVLGAEPSCLLHQPAALADLIDHIIRDASTNSVLAGRYDHIPYLQESFPAPYSHAISPKLLFALTYSWNWLFGYRLASTPASNLISLVAFFKSRLSAARAARKAGKLSGGCCCGAAASDISTTRPASAAESAILSELRRQQLRCLKAKCCGQSNGVVLYMSALEASDYVWTGSGFRGLKILTFWASCRRLLIA